jgi:hypothetical protein
MQRAVASVLAEKLAKRPALDLLKRQGIIEITGPGFIIIILLPLSVNCGYCANHAFF